MKTWENQDNNEEETTKVFAPEPPAPAKVNTKTLKLDQYQENKLKNALSALNNSKFVIKNGEVELSPADAKEMYDLLAAVGIEPYRDIILKVRELL